MRIILLMSILCLGTIAIAQPQPTSAESRLNGYVQRNLLREQSIVKQLPFENIGPTIFSGRVTDIDANPDDPSQFYVAYASGGVWYTDNNGASFTPLFDHQAVMTIGDIAVDWQHNIIWVGTGENNSSRSSYSGLGIYRSADGGKTWEQRGLIESQHIGRIICDRNDTNTVIVAVLGNLYSPSPSRGIYKTTDGGRTWVNTLFVNENAGAIDLIQSPVNPSVMYAATWERTRRAWDFTESGSGSGIYRSDDGGDSWHFLTDSLSGFPHGEGVGRIGLDIASTPTGTLLFAIVDNYLRRPPEAPDTSVLTKNVLKSLSSTQFLALKKKKVEDFLRANDFPEKYTADTLSLLMKQNKITPQTIVDYLTDANTLLFETEVIGAEVYVSRDNGMSWKKTHDGYIDALYNSYGYYFGQIRVSPFDTNRLYVLGVPALRSDDGGVTWASIDADNVHGDHHALWLDTRRDKHLILGNDGGINVSYDDGANYFKCNSPAVGQFYSVTTDRAEPYWVYGGLQDNGVWGGPNNADMGSGWQNSGSYPFKFIFGGDGMQVQVDFRDNNTVYTGFQFGNYARVDKTTRKTVFITPQHDLLEHPYRWNWQSPVLLSRHQQDIVYMGSQYVHRSLNQGDDFEKISPDLTKGGRPGDVSYGTLTTLHESPLEFGLLYAGSDDGLIHVTRDFGQNWIRVSDSLPEDLWVSRLRASSHVKSRVYASLNGYRWDDFEPYIYVSEDYGASWTRIGMDLPKEPVNVIIEDPYNADLLFVGTDNGMYLSLDRGNTWMGMGESLPEVAVHDLNIQPEERELLIGTHGRSFYKADISQLELLTQARLDSQLVVFDIPQSGMRASTRWGNRRTNWGEVQTAEISVPFYCKTPGRVDIEVRFGETPVYRAQINAEKGLNYGKYDLSVDDNKSKGYITRYQEKNADVVIKKAENGKYYLQKGSYTIVLSFAGKKSTQGFELK